MKTYKTYGLVAAAWAALVCTVAVTASAAEGDIWSIRRVSGGDHGTEELSMADNPVTANQTVKFKFRMLNHDPANNFLTNGGLASATTWDNRWYWKYRGGGGTNEAAAAWVSNPPKVGVWVSGRYQWADVESLALVEDNYDYTDLICSYTAKPGDFGLLTLAAGPETAPVEAAVDGTGAAAYCLKNANYWGIYDKITSSFLCNFWLTSLQEADVSAYVTFPNDDSPRWVADRDMSQAGIYIRTIDFDGAKFSDDVWRRVAANGTSSYVNNGNAKRAPALSIPGGVATDHTVTLYAWAEDENVAYMKDGTEYDFGGGVTRHVIHIPIAPADGETREIPGGIFAKASAEGQTTTIYLSATPTNIFRAGVMITNFVTRTISVGPQEPPSIVVKPGGDTDWTAVAGPVDEYPPVVPITVALEGVESYTSDIEVTVTAEMINSSANALDFIGLSKLPAGDPNGTSATVTIPAGQQSAFAYAYVKRANDDTAASTKGISLKATVSDASIQTYFSGGIVPGTLHITAAKPVITAPATDTVLYDVPAGEEFEMSFNVSDAFGELSGNYTLEYTLTGIWSSMNTKTLDIGVPSGSDNTLTTNIIFNTSSPNARFRVRNQDGHVSDEIHLDINVFAKPLIGATPENHVGADGSPSRIYNEGDFARLKFTLGAPFELADQGYIFLVPMTEDSSNLVNTTAFEQGIRVPRGESATLGTATLELLDGSSAGTELRYEFEIWSKPTKTEAGSVRLGTGTDGYASGEITLFVNNVIPKVQGVSMNDTPLYVDGGTMEAKAAKDVTKLFRLDAVDEPSEADLNAVGDDAFMMEWKFYEGGAVITNVVVTGDPYAEVIPYAFKNSGTNKVTVAVKDKDMTTQEYKTSSVFTFYVETLAEPTISMMPYHGSFYFTEQNVGTIDGRVEVRLNIAPTEPIVVKIDVERDGGSDGLTSDPVLNTNLLTFASGTTSKYFYFKELDGDSSFIVRARVITETTSVDPNKTWAEYYHLEEDGGYPMTVDNIAPMIQGVADTNAVPASINVPTKPIQWTAKDVLPDIRWGMTASWTVEGATIDVPITYTNATGTVLGTVGGSYSPTFTSAGLKVVTLTVTDKNGLSDTRRYYFIIEASKELFLYPLGPKSRGAGSLFTNPYLSAPGRGVGRVWADGGEPTISNFSQKWTLAATLDSVNVYGYGYRAGEQATGSLTPGKDYRLTPDGYRTSGSNLYNADPLRDSFFYCWILNTREENGNYTGEFLGSILPAVGTDTIDIAEQPVGLPDYDAEAVQYERRYVEGIFSKEYLVKDNVGDINQDGIPDIYAASVAWEGVGASSDGSGGAVATDGGGTRLFEVAGFGGAAGGDLKKLASYNGDEDYLPSKTSAGGNLIPNIASAWATYGEPFTAYLELRGYGEGLNYREDVKTGQGRNSGGKWISDRDFTEAESNAWDKVYGLAQDWTPENRTDPTVDDTDEDGLPDGYEYYIWYHAYVGWMEDGKLKRLEGSRFQIDDIAVGVKIAPEDIAKAFNPNSPASNVSERDTDMDGLTDLEEFAIGTNPVHWDTDGDGCSDYWEVMRGLNPLVAESDSTTPNANPDGDYMAWAEVGKDYALLTLPDGRMFAVPKNGGMLVQQDGDDYFVNEEFADNAEGIEVYRYGNASSTLVPVNRGEWESSDKMTLNGRTLKQVQEFTCTSKPLDLAPIEWGDDIEFSNVTVKVDQKLTLVHEQVRAQYGFDPRTGWHRNVNGYCVDRWDPNLNPVKARRIRGSAGDHNLEPGYAVNTKAYSNLDEYLLLKYRYMTKGGAPGGDLSRDLAKDKAKWQEKTSALGGIFKAGTTNPNAPYSDKTYGDYGKSSSGEEGETQTTFEDKTHGADTDGDGVPDGWELYVSFDPNVKKDGIVEVDGDDLALTREYAGTDSCDVYKSAVAVVDGTDSSNDSSSEDEDGDTSWNIAGATIYNNHTGRRTGWYNKFFPTDPWDGDTDGDNIADSTEGASWKNACVLNNAMKLSTEGGDSYNFTFIYGEPVDDGSLCIRGGGMNPCSVDTDFDLLPDPWEMCFAGVRAEGGTLQGATFGSAVTTLCRRNDGLDTGTTNSTANGVYITAGMDATFGVREDIANFTGDAYTNPSFKDPRTGTVRNFDFDQDGLQNFQEYLTQTLRHLRYDDSETPLMGSWMPSGSPGSRKFLGFLPMNIMDGETFYAMAKEKGFVATGAWQFHELGYFARPPHEWDPIALIPRSMSEYDETGYRILLPPHALAPDGSRLDPYGYASTDPRMWDSDGDSMGDYYELFHGLNPLLGSIANTEPLPDGMPDAAYDVISRAYNGAITFWCNGWTGWPMLPQDWLSGDVAYRDIDAVKYPWMIGTPEADADGDGIRNGEEALIVNMTSPQPTHTDPTPLWLTDSTALNSASFTAQYYVRDLELESYGWAWTVSGQTGVGATPGFLFSFEENEGYDTDGDWISDSDEQHMTATPISDPQNFTDPDRRQAIWFPGENSAAVSYSAKFNPLNYGAYDFLRQFTVEARIKPEDVSRDQVILERVAVYGASNLSNNIAKVRANFRIGIRADGRLYGLFDTNDAVTSGEGDGTAYVLGLAVTANEWMHVALSFNGKKLNLYMDGILVGSQATTQIPANGIINLVEDAAPNMVNFPVLGDGYDTVPSAIVLGAQALDVNGLWLSDKSTWTSYGAFYKGYIDEVRVWDGARSMNDIVENMKKRYSFSNVAAERDALYSAWLRGATRNDNDGYDNLPAELVAHYNFQTLPGATDANFVAWEPSGFTKNVRNLGKVEGNNVPGDIYSGWWYSIPIHSTVYKNYRLVPWIQNTVGHLPIMDGSTVDSQFWSEYYGGMTVPSELNGGLSKILFPNTANPYPYYIFTTERRYHEFKLKQMVDQKLLPNDVAKRYQFELNHTIVSSSDMVPLGGAFAKRCDDMWDGNGPADAWALTLRDTNANGIPDWWEKVAIAQYGATAGFTWDSLVTWDGRKMTAREAYLRDLQRGMLPTGASGGAVNGSYENSADADYDGLPDWWEDLFGIRSQSGLDDADNDGLSNYAEWLISEAFSQYGFPRVNPLLAHTLADEQGQKVPDYFLKVGKPYLGDMFADHDFMEDQWEDQFDPDFVSRYKFDAWDDSDNDGWSNFAECRAATDPTKQNRAGVDGYVTSEHPVPVITAKIAYNGNATLDSTIIVQAYSSGQIGQVPNAIWKIGGSGTSEKYLGYNPLSRVTMSLGPGAVTPGSINVQFKCSIWNNNGSTGYLDTCPWYALIRDAPDANNGETMGLLFGYFDTDFVVGWVNYETGDMELDLSKMNKSYTVRPDENSYQIYYPDKAYVKIGWQSAVPAGNIRVEAMLRDPEMAAAGISLGAVREGKNTFVAFLDYSNDGIWNPGEPYGVAADVDVGWSGSAFALEMTDTSPQTMRINLGEAVAQNEFSAQSGFSDRGVSLFGKGANVSVPEGHEGTNMPISTATDVTVRFVRTAVNGVERRVVSGATYYANYGVLTVKKNLAANPYLTELDLVDAGVLDLDWGGLTGTSDLGVAPANVTSVRYRLVLGDGSILPTVTNNNLATCFVNTFDTEQPTCSLISPRGAVFTQPTFNWKYTSAIGKAYPAFRLRVYTAKTGGTLVYDSGNRRSPPQNVDGSYSWTAPIYPDMMTPSGKIFATTNNYFWTVSMLDAKYTTPLSSQSRIEFRLEASGMLGTVSDYGKIKAKVRYFGPGTVATGKTNGLIRVQAFTSPDFTGMPAGEARVKNTSKLASIDGSHDTCIDDSGDDANAVILGLKPGTYYVRAFIDTDGNATWSRWESWGYGNYVGAWDAALIRITRGAIGSDATTFAATAFPYTPRPYKVEVGAATPVAEIYIEDMDTDADHLPDVYEKDTEGNLYARSTPTGSTFFTKVNKSLATTVSSYTKLNDAAAGTTYAPITLMNTILSGSDPYVTAAAIDLLSDGAGTENVAVKIDSFSLADGLALSITSDVTTPEADDLSVFTVADSAKVKVVLVAAKSPDFANASETAVKTITINANEVKSEIVTAEELRAAIDAAGLNDAAFFKVRLEEAE